MKVHLGFLFFNQTLPGRILEMKRYLVHIIATIAIILCTMGQSLATTIDFEGIADSTPITSQYNGLGVAFSGATAITAGESLNEFEFPPYSGNNVVFDETGGISITFATPMSQVGGYFTYLYPLTLRAYNFSDSLVGTINSSYSSNLALSGDPGSSPNEFLQFSYMPGISRVVLEGDSLGGSFTLDDLNFTVSSVPLPGSMYLFISGIIGILTLRRKLS